MKKFLVVFFFFLLGASAAFAQQRSSGGGKSSSGSGAANALSLDLFPLAKGYIASDGDADTSFYCGFLAYERLVGDSFGIGVQLDLVSGEIAKVDYFYFGLSALGRYYPMSPFEKVFFGASLGFNRQSIDGKAKPANGGFTDLTIALQAGYRLMLTGSIYIEPSMSYVLSRTTGVPVTPLGWQGGLRLGFAF
jgi:hypothetical protein